MFIEKNVRNFFLIAIFGSLSLLGAVSFITGISLIFLGENFGKIAIAISSGTIVTLSSIFFITRIDR